VHSTQGVSQVTKRILLEMRPALDGFYGIPQETRLLFAALAAVPDFQVSGLLQMSKRPLRGGMYGERAISEAERIHRFSRVVVSLKGRTSVDWKADVGEWIANFRQDMILRLRSWLGVGHIPLGRFETRYFEDFIWQELFARTLPAADRATVLRGNYAICAAPWRRMHMMGIERAKMFGTPKYPQLETKEFDVFITQTPFPGRVRRGTALVIHYHDAIPVLMPHTISDRAFHQASHYHALAANVRDGAYFVCVSDATRNDLVHLFPEAEARAVTIHNVLPSHYYPAAPEPERVPDIVRRYLHGEFEGKPKGALKEKGQVYRLSRRFGNEEEKTAYYRRVLGPGSRFLLMVSTIEPRKNHARLLAAWEALHSKDPELKLVLVGHIGWDHQAALEGMLPWTEEGSLFLLQNVPADALRLLFRHAIVTVCPSVGEGFDFSGAEAMRCGGVVAASDIPVHREVYGDAAIYFDPYDTQSLVDALRPMIYEEGAEELQARLRVSGLEQSAQYLPERILPKWQAFLQLVAAKSTPSVVLSECDVVSATAVPQLLETSS
jgi:glycosyltransferase involved in cell wall biosynthesis